MSKTPSLVDIVGATHEGMLRSHNEDRHAVDAAAGYAILADGMGGYNAGEVASEMAVTQLTAALRSHAGGTTPPHELLRQEVGLINAAIHTAAQTQHNLAGMGTTLVSALFHPGRVTVVHVGDSRLYRLRAGVFEAITRDHSVLQEQLDGGLLTPEEARQSQHKNLVTRALGVEPGVEAEVHEHDTLPDDVYLLCSDGLNDMVADESIGQIVAAGGQDLAGAAARLIEQANQNGGRDNVTVILARVLAEQEERGMMARLSGWIRHAG